MADSIEQHLNEAEQKAWDAIHRYKFQMFGYWAAIWVHLNRIEGKRRPNPWRGLVQFAKRHEIGASNGESQQGHADGQHHA